jgi:hypothetical protein
VPINPKRRQPQAVRSGITFTDASVKVITGGRYTTAMATL